MINRICGLKGMSPVSWMSSAYSPGHNSYCCQLQRKGFQAVDKGGRVALRDLEACLQSTHLKLVGGRRMMCGHLWKPVKKEQLDNMQQPATACSNQLACSKPECFNFKLSCRI